MSGGKTVAQCSLTLRRRFPLCRCAAESNIENGRDDMVVLMREGMPTKRIRPGAFITARTKLVRSTRIEGPD